MTNREKAERAAVKKRLQEDGILPPNKTRLNRKKFASDTIREFNESMTEYGDHIYLHKAIACMVSEDMKTVRDEGVGVLKALKLATVIKKFHESLHEQGRTSYTNGEFFDAVSPILKL